MVQGRKSPVCMYCGKRAATWPPKALLKMFCTVSCAAQYGAEQGTDKLYCKKHEDWYYYDEGCSECKSDQLAKRSK